MFRCNHDLSPILYNKSNMTGATCGAVIAYPSGAPEFACFLLLLVGFMLSSYTSPHAELELNSNH